MPAPAFTPELVAERLAAIEAGDRQAAKVLFADDGALAAARRGGTALVFRFLCAQLGHVLDEHGSYPDDEPRERYSALLDEFGSDAGQLAVIRALGARLHQLERDGTLPRAMVVRTRRRDERP